MSPEPRSQSQPPLDRPVPRAPISADRPLSFSQVADEHRVMGPAIDSLFEHLPVGVLIVDRDGRVAYANRAAHALHVERLERVQWAITRALLVENAVREDEIEIVSPGNPSRWLSAQVVPVRVPGRGVHAALVTIADVTARTRLTAWNPVIESLVNL